MDYGKVLSRAWQITWRWKALWFLGFLVSLGSGFSTGSSGYQYGREDMGGWTTKFQDPAFVAAIVGVAIAVGCLAILVAIALAVVSVMARGGLIAGVRQVEDEGATSFRQAWRVGRQRFWTLFGVSVLTALPILVLVVLLVAGVAVWAIGMSQGGVDFDAALGANIALAVACGGLVCCIMLPLGLILGGIQVYADRAAILEGLGWIDAFKRGWQVLKQNLGPTIVLWLIFLAIGLVFGLAVAAGAAVLLVPIAAAFGVNAPEWVWIPVCLGGLIGAVIAALISAVYQTFYSATWTLAYRRLTGIVSGAAQSATIAPPAAEPPELPPFELEPLPPEPAPES